MYLPKSKYNKPKYTRGDELTLESGKSYTGWYFSTYKGEYYTGKEPSDNSDKLILQNDSDSHTSTIPGFQTQLNIPTEKDYSKGFFTRYFVQDKRTKKMIEVGKEKYDKLSSLSYVKTVLVDWNLTSPAQDVKKGPYIYFGSASKNKEAIIEAEKTIPQLSSMIKNYAEFVK